MISRTNKNVSLKERFFLNLTLKQKLIYGGIAAFIILLAVLFINPYSRNSILRTFMSNDSYYSLVTKQSLNQHSDDFIAKYSDKLNTYKDNNSGVHYSIDFNMSTSKQLVSMLKLLSSDKTLIKLLSEVKNIGLTSSVRIKNNVYQADGVLLLNDNKVVKFTSAYNTDKQILYYQIPALNPSWLKLSLADAKVKIKEKLADITKITNTSKALDLYLNRSDIIGLESLESYTNMKPDYLINAKDTQRLVSDCICAVIDDIDDVSMDKKVSLQIDDSDISCTALTAKVSQSKVKEMTDVIYSELTSNDSFKELLKNLKISNDDLKKQLGLVSDSVNSKTSTLEPVIITNWVNNKGIIIGCELTLPVREGEPIKLGYAISSHKSDTISKYWINNLSGVTLTFSGNDSVKNNKHDGDFSINLDGSKLGDIKISYKDFEITDSIRGYANGTFEIAPEGLLAIYKQVVTLKASKDAQTIKTSIVAGSSTLTDMSLSYKRSDSCSFFIPSKSLNAASKEDLKSYISSSTVSDFKKEIKKTLNNDTLSSVFDEFMNTLGYKDVDGVKRSDDYVDDLENYSNDDDNDSSDSSDKSKSPSKTSSPSKKTPAPKKGNNEDPTEHRIDDSGNQEKAKDVTVDVDKVKKSGDTSTAFETADIKFSKIKTKLEDYFKDKFGSCPSPDKTSECTDTYYEDDLLVKSYTNTYDYYFNDDYTEYASVIVDLNTDKIAEMNMSTPSKSTAQAVCVKYLSLLGTSTKDISNKLSSAYSSEDSKEFNAGDYVVFATSNKVKSKTYYSISVSLKP